MAALAAFTRPLLAVGRMAAFFVLAGTYHVSAAPPKEKPLPTIVFTDEKAGGISPKGGTPSTEIEYELKLLTINGLEGKGQRRALLDLTGGFELAPVSEGVHILKFTGGEEYRFLAIRPPEKLDVERVRKALPQTASALLGGSPYVIGAYGDSVTATGHYPEILAKLLSRALDRPTAIRIVRRAHSGRSIDATARTWSSEVATEPPHLAMIMYGLNDQAGGVSLDAYLEHYKVLAERFREELKADVLLLQPTPHIDVFPKGKPGEEPNAPSYVFRTLGFATELRILGHKMSLPCAETFQAVWGEGGATLAGSAERMRAYFPPSYSKPMHSMLESANPMAGDTIHPNILGHLAMARAVLATLGGPEEAPLPAALRDLKAVSRWKDGGVITEVFGLEKVRTHEPVEYVAFPDRKPLRQVPGTSHVLAWPELAANEKLMDSPEGREFAAERGMIAVAATVDGKTRVVGVPAPLTPRAGFERRRWNAVQHVVDVPVGMRGEAGDEGARELFRVNIPVERESGNMLLFKKFDTKSPASGNTAEIPAFARLWYTRYALAQRVDNEDVVKIDGDLSEWNEVTWSTLGDPDHARWIRGPQDFRTSPEECMLKFAIRAGKGGMYMAIRCSGSVERDRFTLFFDPRAPELLGSPGEYFWVSGDFPKFPGVRVRSGETSPKLPVCQSASKVADGGLQLEIFVPYEVMGQTAWPASGDLGFTFWWTHVGGDKKVTHLQWSDIGHPWNTRWFGVVRIGKKGDAMPFMVRVE
ncbi:hypothetical protein DB346_20610 [Verrucomicrobia bacterium LW23]|nr:hypothetical protein DB346_20610 [Verrucomicrobia bacterium LW23]